MTQARPPAGCCLGTLQVQAAVAAAEAALGPIDVAIANAGVAIMGARPPRAHRCRRLQGAHAATGTCGRPISLHDRVTPSKSVLGRHAAACADARMQRSLEPRSRHLQRGTCCRAWGTADVLPVRGACMPGRETRACSPQAPSTSAATSMRRPRRQQ